jgi:hypothetical protein
MTVSEIMTTDVVTVSPAMSIAGARGVAGRGPTREQLSTTAWFIVGHAATVCVTTPRRTQSVQVRRTTMATTSAPSPRGKPVITTARTNKTAIEAHRRKSGQVSMKGERHIGAREDQMAWTMPPKGDDDEPKQG